MDATKIEIVIKQLDKLIEVLTPHSSFWTSSLFAVLLGGLIAITSQIILFYLNRQIDKKIVLKKLFLVKESMPTH